VTGARTTNGRPYAAYRTQQTAVRQPPRLPRTPRSLEVIHRFRRLQRFGVLLPRHQVTKLSESKALFVTLWWTPRSHLLCHGGSSDCYSQRCPGYCPGSCSEGDPHSFLRGFLRCCVAGSPPSSPGRSSPRLSRSCAASSRSSYSASRSPGSSPSFPRSCFAYCSAHRPGGGGGCFAEIGDSGLRIWGLGRLLESGEVCTMIHIEKRGSTVRAPSIRSFRDTALFLIGSVSIRRRHELPVSGLQVPLPFRHLCSGPCSSCLTVPFPSARNHVTHSTRLFMMNPFVSDSRLWIDAADCRGFQPPVCGRQ